LEKITTLEIQYRKKIDYFFFEKVTKSEVKLREKKIFFWTCKVLIEVWAVFKALAPMNREATIMLYWHFRNAK